jgi:membrane protein required for colicin V production
MEIYDLLMLIVLVAATLLGAWKGMVWQLASLSSIFVSYFVAVQFRAPVAAKISADPPWNVFLAMLILYLGTALVIWIIFRQVANTIDRLKLREFDRQVGAVFGAAKGVVLCVVITLFAVTLLGDQQRRAIVESRSGYYIACLLDRAQAVMPREVHQVLDPYLRELDQRLNAGRPDPYAPGPELPEWEAYGPSRRAATDTDQRVGRY